jgi:Bacteriophage probable baseplate hub protein
VTRYYAPSFRIQVNGSRLKGDVSAEITQVQVVSKPDTLDTFSFTIANTLPKMRWTHTPDGDLFREGSAVKIALGYVDDLQDMIEGEITQISPSFPQDGIPTIVIEGHTLLHRLHGSNNTRTFQNVSDKAIVEKIAQDAHLQAEAEDPQVQYEYVMQPNQTDLEFLRDRARRLHFEILVENKKLIFRRSREQTTNTYTLVWAHAQKAIAMGSNTLPLSTFSLQMNASKPATSVESRSYDPASKQAFVARAGPDDQTSSMGGTKKGGDVTSAAFQRECKHVHVVTPFPSQSACNAHAKATYNNKAMGLVSGTAETIGVPDLRGGQIIKLLGVGLRFEGDYRIDEATHSIGSDGYKTSLTVKRNSVS